MPRSSRSRSRKHEGYREERERSESDEDSRPREQEERKVSAWISKGLEQHEKRLSSSLAKPPDAEHNYCSSVERQKKRKDREEVVTGYDRWNGGGSVEDDGFSYYDSKRYRNADVNVKGKPVRKPDESDMYHEGGSRKSNREALLEKDGVEHQEQYHLGKEKGREHGAEKWKESKREALLMEDTVELYKAEKDSSREHAMDKGNESRQEASLKVPSRGKEAKRQEWEDDKLGSKYKMNNDCQVQDELHNGELVENERHMKARGHSGGKQSGSKDRQILSRDGDTKTDECAEEQSREERYNDEVSRDEERPRERKYKDERSRVEDKLRDKKCKDERRKEEVRPRDERYKEERPSNKDKHRDERYKEERSKEEDRLRDDRYREEKSRDEDKPRNERSKGENSREKYRDDIYRNHRHQDGRAWDARSSREVRSLDKHYREDYSFSESRYSKSRLRDIDNNTLAIDGRSSKCRDDTKGKKRPYEENDDNSDLEPRNGKEQHGDAAKHKSEVSSFGSSADRRREYLLQENVDSRRRDYQQKSSPTSSTFLVREQSRHFSKQEESSAREHGGASGQHRRTSDFQSVEERIKTNTNTSESSTVSRDDRSFRSDGRPTHFADKSLSSSNWQYPDRSSLRLSHDIDDPLNKNNARQHELPLNRQFAENYQSASPVRFPPPPDRFEINTRSSLEEDNNNQIRERRSSSRSRRSGTVSNTRGHGNTWNNPSAWPSPIPNGFAPFQHVPPLPGFHPTINQYPPQSLFAMQPSLDMTHAVIPYPLHDQHDIFSGRAQPFTWRNPAEGPYLPRLPGWDASRDVFEDYPHGYDRPELDRNRNLDLNQQSELAFSIHASSDKPSIVQSLGENQGEQSNADSSEIKTPDEAHTEKTDGQASRVKSERELGPSNVTADNFQFHDNYFKRLDISTSLVSSGLYKKCVPIVGKSDPAGSCNRIMHPCLKNNIDEYGCRVKGSNCMIKSLFSEKRNSIFENAMALYRSCTGSMKLRTPVSSAHLDGEKVVQQASVAGPMEEDDHAPEDQAVSLGNMCNAKHNNDQPHCVDVLNRACESGLAENSCKNTVDATIKPGDSIEEEKADADNGERCPADCFQKGSRPSINRSEGHACHIEQQQGPNNDEGGLPRDAKDLQPACCNAEGNLTDVAKEQLCGVISDAAFASSSQACEGVMPGCRFNLSRIPCSPGST